MKKNIIYGENTYPEVVRHCSLGSLIASIRSELIVLPSSDELTTTVPGKCHHTWVVERNQVTQHLVDQHLPLVPLKVVVNAGPTDITNSVN
jgi:hypothetical protein